MWIFLDYSVWHFRFRIHWAFNYKCFTSRSVSCYTVKCFILILRDSYRCRSGCHIRQHLTIRAVKKKVFLTDTPWHKSDTWFCYDVQNYIFRFKNLSFWFVLKISYHQVTRLRIISNTWHILCHYNTNHISSVLGFSDAISPPPFCSRFILTLSRSTTSGCYFISMLVSQLANFILILQTALY